jgi:hypothetical protein
LGKYAIHNAPYFSALPSSAFEARRVPALIRRRPRLLERLLRADDLHRILRTERVGRVVAVGEIAQARMKRVDVIELEVYLEERLPVARHMVDHHPVEHVVRKIEIGRDRQVGKIRARVALAFEEQAVPLAQWRRVQLHARILGKLRRTEQISMQIVGPAMQRADDILRVAVPFQQDRLAMPADVREQLDAGFVAHQHLRIVESRKHAIVADMGHHALVTDVPRACFEHELLLFSKIAGSKYHDTGSWQRAGVRCCGPLRRTYIPRC